MNKPTIINKKKFHLTRKHQNNKKDKKMAYKIEKACDLCKDENNNKCKYCEQEFTRVYNLKRHIEKRCKKKI